jgi:hypothetical protein
MRALTARAAASATQSLDQPGTRDRSSPAAAETDNAWSVLQAGMYADLFQRWADQAGDTASAVLRGMAEQRHQIGLAPEAQFKLASPVTVVPVVAIDWRARDSAVHKLNEVLLTLRSAHLADDMRVRRVNLVGRLDPIE